MPAAIADIAAATRDVVTATWSDPAIAARYPGARDSSIGTAPGYFDLVADAQAVANARGALIGVERRRFAVDAAELIWPDVTSGVSQARVIDAEQRVDGTFLAARIELDLDAETTSFELFG